MPPSANRHIQRAEALAREALATTDILSINEIALQLFRIQAEHVPVYSSFLEQLRVDPKKIDSIEGVPHLPIAFFRSHDVLMKGVEPALEFHSSGTTSAGHSIHKVADLGLYELSSIRCFESLIGPLEDLCILGILPNYLEQKNSSLVHMVRLFMEQSGNEQSGFYLDQFDELANEIIKQETKGQRTLLIGVPYALLDFLESRKLELNHTILMETGGMKGRRKEMVRSELHEELKNKTGLENIYSEYGMTELLSQAYSKGNGIFKCPPWMRVSIRQVSDPFNKARPGKTGGLDIMDLANAHSCAFISTMDLGREVRSGGFEILGRFDNSDIRGCNLLVQ